MKRFGLFAVLLLATFSFAQTQTPPLRESVTVSAEGKFESAPDTAIIAFHMSAQEEVLKVAYERASRAAEQIRQTLRANGIDPKSAEIGYFQVTPVYDWRNPKRRLVGYQVNSDVSLKLKDFNKVAPLAAAFTEMDVTQSQTISYMLDNVDAAKIAAVQDAMRRAHAMAETTAKAGGRTLGDLAHASVDVFEPVRPMMADAGMRTMKAATAEAAPTEGFSAQKITVTAHVNCEYLLR